VRFDENWPVAQVVVVRYVDVEGYYSRNSFFPVPLPFLIVRETNPVDQLS
jgi:hypothetical protein